MARKKKTTPNPQDPEDPRDEYLSRFIRDAKGKDLGESVGVDGDMLIIKDKMDFFKIPMKSATILESHIEIKGKVNWKKARKDGERWRASELDPLYSGDEADG